MQKSCWRTKMPEPRLFAVPLGAPYPAAFVEGVLSRFGEGAPEDLARLTILANTRRMAGAIGEAFAARGVALLPRLLTLTDIARHPAALTLPPAADPLALRLELTTLTRRLLEADPTVGPPEAAFDLAGTLLRLLGEMGGEGVGITALEALDVSGHSTHWSRSLAFVALIARYLDAREGAAEAEAHQRAANLLVRKAWQSDPPRAPVLIAGSTGSRGTTRSLMEAVAHLPDGFVVLPGFDRNLPDDLWADLDEAHPQYRFRALMDALGLGPDAVDHWAGSPADAARSKVLSLALRPPPVTDQWLSEGAALPPLETALSRVTLVEAPSPRAEAVAIALGLRAAVEDGRRAALVTPDRVLTRRVTAALSRWGIEPDDSAGRPLALSAPGRLLREVAATLVGSPEAGAFLALLKHPLVARGGGRGPHLLMLREFEIWLRRKGHPFTGAESLRTWSGDDTKRLSWVKWIAPLILPADAGAIPLETWLAILLGRARSLVSGPEVGPFDELWKGPAGEAAAAAVAALENAAPGAGAVTALDAARILDGVLQDEVRDPLLPHADVMIRGTIEVRALDADLVILAGLNDGIWPPAPDPDPWLNQSLRQAAGLLSPERRTGLSAHDFEQGFNAPEVWLTRTLRDDEGETVPSRWLNRLTGLVGGLADNGGENALKAMMARGARWTAMAEGLDRRAPPVPPASRPAPAPRVEFRPRKLSVTEIQPLIRDPYAIYARHVLRLRALPPPLREADARLRGTALHRVAERFIRSGPTGNVEADRAALLAVAERVFAEMIPWPVTRRLWLARLDRIAADFLAGEAERRARGSLVALETSGTFQLEDPRFTLTGTADRIDREAEGFAIFDYKSGTVPTEKEVLHFDRQLFLEAVMVEAGAFEAIGRGKVRRVAHIGLGANPEVREYDLAEPKQESLRIETVLAQFARLVAAYLSERQGFASRRAMQKAGYEGDYDHLARFGEWDETVAPIREDLP